MYRPCFFVLKRSLKNNVPTGFLVFFFQLLSKTLDAAILNPDYWKRKMTYTFSRAYRTCIVPIGQSVFIRFQRDTVAVVGTSLVSRQKRFTVPDTRVRVVSRTSGDFSTRPATQNPREALRPSPISAETGKNELIWQMSTILTSATPGRPRFVSVTRSETNDGQARAIHSRTWKRSRTTFTVNKRF